MGESVDRTSSDDRAFEMLRDADPVAGVPDPDLSEIRTRVIAKAATEEFGYSQQRWWRTPTKVMPAVIAASCALMLGAGGLGYFLGASKEPVAIAVEDTRNSLNSSTKEKTEIGAPGGGQSNSDVAGFLWGEWGDGRTVYLRGWDSEPKFSSDAEAYYYAPLSDAEAEERLRNLADALGLRADMIKTEYGDWTIENLGKFEYFNFSRDALGNFYYSNDSVWQTCVPDGSSPGGEDLLPEPGSVSGSTAGDSSTGQDLGRVCEPSLLDFAATSRGAILAAQEILASSGLPVADFAWTADSSSKARGSSADTGGEVWVTATPRVGDVDAIWTFQFHNDEKPTSVSGNIAVLSSLGKYPIVTASEALQRLNDPRFGPIMGHWVYGKTGVAISEGDEIEPNTGVNNNSGLNRGNKDTSSLPPLSPGSPIWWPVQTVTFSSVSLGLVRHYSGMGVSIVPAYVMKTSDGVEVRVLAVADSALDTDPRQR